MKSKVLSLMILLIGILSINIIKASTTGRNLIGKVIYIDPGHPSEIKPSINRISCSKL